MVDVFFGGCFVLETVLFASATDCAAFLEVEDALEAVVVLFATVLADFVDFFSLAAGVVAFFFVVAADADFRPLASALSATGFALVAAFLLTAAVFV